MKRGKKTRANDARDLSFFISDRMELARRLFLALKPSEVKAMAPKFAKDLPMDDIKALCLEELINMSTKSLRAILGAPPDTVVLDSDSDAEESSAPSSKTETSDSDSNDSDGSDGTSETSDVSDDVMVIDDSDVEDTKADIDNKQQLLNGNKNISKGNKADAENRNGCNSEADLRDKYLDRINKLDILTAKLGQEIDKLSKKKKTAGQNSIGDYVNEMVSELTKIDSEISTEHNMMRRNESAEQMDTDVTEETVDKTSNIHHSKRKTRRKEAIEDIEVTTNNKISKVAKNSVKKRPKLKNKPRKQNVAAIVQCNRTQPEAVKNQREIKKTLDGATVTSNKKVNRLTEKDNRKDPTEDVEATVCLLSDSDDSQDEIESELQESIAKTRKKQVLGKETQMDKPNDMVKQTTNKTSLDKRKKPFSEDDIEIEIVVDGGPNLDNRKISIIESAKGAYAKGKGKDRNKNASKPSSEALVNGMIQKLNSSNSKQLQKDSTDQITLLSSGSDDSDNNTSAAEDGEIDSLSDESEDSKVNKVSKRRKRKTRLVKITSKKCGGDKQDIDVDAITITTNSNVLTERNNDDKRPQLRSSIIKVTDDDKLTETNINKVKSIAVTMPQAKENCVKPKDIDSITVVVKNTCENEATNIERIVKMTEDIRSVESVVVGVRNKHLIADERSHLPFDKHDTNKSTKAEVVIRPEERKFVAKASDFHFVKPKHCQKPILMLRETSEATKCSTPIETNKSFTFDDENDMDVLDINLQDVICTDIIEQDVVEKHILHSASVEIGTNNVRSFLVKSANNNYETSTDNRTHSCGEVEVTETTARLIDVVDPTTVSKDTLKKIVTKTNMVSDSAEKVSTVTFCDETVMQYTFENNQMSNIDASVHETKTINNTKQIDGERNLTNINNCTIENTLFKNAKVDVEEIVQYSFENKFEPMTTDAENEERVEIATEIEKTDNIVNIESTNNDYSQQSVTLCTEAILCDSENLALVKNSVEKVLAMSLLDTACTSAVTEASTLNQANQSLEEGELDSTVERCSPHPAILLEDGELASKAIEDGELTDPSSSDVESVEIPNEIISISDEEPGQDTCGVELPADKLKKKKKKKEKKQKKEEKRHRKCKGKCKHKAEDKKIEPLMIDVKQLDGDGNSNVKDSETINNVASDTMIDLSIAQEVKIGIVNIETSVKHAEASKDKISEADDIKVIQIETTSNSSKTSNEIKDSSQKVIDMLSIEISSDDSSDEPVFENLDELTAAIDGIENQQVAEHHESLVDDEEGVENVSWRDRYLDSKKVKKVLTTANILNALRKKNKELKKKLLESKQVDNTQEVTPEPAPVAESLQAEIEEGSIEHYNTLQSLTKFVDPVLDPADQADAQTKAENVDKEKAVEGNVTKEMKKNAKNLLKMYKKLLKYNDMNRASNPNKKAKKKKRKKDETG